jgi:hypothetical protein
MKTKQIPYVCPVCQGNGNGPTEEAPKDEYRYLKTEDALQEGDEERRPCLGTGGGLFWETISYSRVGNTVTLGGEKEKCFRRKVPSVPAFQPKCKACGGACVLWGTETDDSVDFDKATINPTPQPPTDPLPWGPYVPYSPYWQPGVTWCSSTFNPATQKYELISQGSCEYPNFGF